MRRRSVIKKELIETVLDKAGVRLNGDQAWDVRVHDERLYERVLCEKSLGFGEAYMEGWWDCERIDQLIARLLHAKAAQRLGTNMRHVRDAALWCFFNMQSLARSRVVAQRHYDLGNDLFEAFLDPYMQYSCAYFEGTDELNQAQKNKLELICRKLCLTADDHLLDIGCGWGGLARYAAEQYGCKVTGITISDEQLQLCREHCKHLPVTFEKQDYRAMTGQFSKIVSVGMFEHVGYKNYQTFFEVAERCLKPNGIMLLHTIGSNTSKRNGTDAWLDKYIFPNSMLPSMAQMTAAMEGRFVLEDVHNIGPHYETTLLAWNENFQRAWPDLAARYDARFKRMWEYYLLSCAATFRARQTQLWQLVLTPPRTRQPYPREKDDWPRARWRHPAARNNGPRQSRRWHGRGHPLQRPRVWRHPLPTALPALHASRLENVLPGKYSPTVQDS